MMVSLGTQYKQLVLAQGVLFGIACGMIVTPVVLTVGQCLITKRALAMGVVASGAFIGGIIFSIALNHLLSNASMGFGWRIRIIGFIVLELLTIACAVVKEHLPRRFFIAEAFRSFPYIFTTLGFFFSLLGFWTPVFYPAS